MIPKQEDTQLGELTWDPRFHWWEGRLRMPNGSEFKLYLETPSNDDQSLTEASRKAAAMIVQSDLEIRLFAANKLLSTLNESWNEGEPISEEEFTKRMSPSGVTIEADGDAELSYLDDAMFCGHYIEVRYRDGELSEAMIGG